MSTHHPMVKVTASFFFFFFFFLLLVVIVVVAVVLYINIIITMQSCTILIFIIQYQYTLYVLMGIPPSVKKCIIY